MKKENTKNKETKDMESKNKSAELIILVGLIAFVTYVLREEFAQINFFEKLETLNKKFEEGEK